MSKPTANPFQYPEWLVLHVPHDSHLIPDSVLVQYIIDEEELKSELLQMTDHYTCELYCSGVNSTQVIRAPVSRLVVDVERFEDDANEMMAARGMGAVYMSGSQLQPLRRVLSESERELLLDKDYRPHHLKLTLAFDRVLDSHDHAFILDCHSFPSKPLPYEFDTADQKRTDICLGTDSTHTPKHVVDVFTSEFERLGLSVAINSPFAGTLVPQKHYQIDDRVTSLMIEVNRALYLEESSGFKNKSFQQTEITIRQAICKALENI